MRIENGVIVGSNGKYEIGNPIARYLISRFDRAVLESIRESSPSSVLEVGCGEGHVTDLILKSGVSRLLATDISVSLIKENSMRSNDPRVTFKVADLMSLSVEERYDLVVCCEVLEHVEDPDRALDILHALDAREYVLSVPREPIWRILNICRGAYLRDLGNSPGHIHHFSRRAFVKFVERRFVVQSIRSPVPWTVLRCRPK
ncbi:MAG: class I SAM-dependent methyltransferase [Desulfosoma sp.]